MSNIFEVNVTGYIEAVKDSDEFGLLKNKMLTNEPLTSVDVPELNIKSLLFVRGVEMWQTGGIVYGKFALG